MRRAYHVEIGKGDNSEGCQCQDVNLVTLEVGEWDGTVWEPCRHGSTIVQVAGEGPDENGLWPGLLCSNDGGPPAEASPPDPLS